MKCDLSGRVTLITGAAQGIGRAIGDRFADCGSRVVYTDVDAAGAQEAASRRPSCLSMRMDVADREEVNRVITAVLEQCGQIDILINNAGVNTIAGRTTIDAYPASEWDRVLAVDITGIFNVSRAVTPAMRARGQGRVINIASIAGLVPLRLQCAFVAAKAGVINLTKGMALELAPCGILVNAIAPGSIVTDATRKLFYGDDGVQRESAQRMLDHVPLGRAGTVAEIAIAALFLADPENSYMTGHVLTVDGGWTAGGFARDF